jgi:hypothetical protein
LTVAELIAALQALPADAEVTASFYPNDRNQSDVTEAVYHEPSADRLDLAGRVEIR